MSVKRRKPVFYRDLTEQFKDEVVEYYKNHSRVNTANKFKINDSFVDRILDERHIHRRSGMENKILSCREKFGTDFAAQAPIVKQHQKETMIREHGVDNIFRKKEYIRECVHNKYGVDSVMQVDSIKEKLKSNNIKKHGVAWPMQRAECRAKSKKTCEERYGGQGFASKEIMGKCKAAWKKKFGTENVMASPIVKKHTVENNQKKYGVDWCCQLPQARSRKTISKLNLALKKKFEENDLVVTQLEKGIGGYSYDFQIGDDILVELNPSCTHNLTYGVYSDKSSLSYDYHYNKSGKAYFNKYNCIHIWDWDNIDNIIKMLKCKEPEIRNNFDGKEVSEKEFDSFNDKFTCSYYDKGNKFYIFYINGEPYASCTIKKLDKEYIGYDCYIQTRAYKTNLIPYILSYFIDEFNPEKLNFMVDPDKQFVRPYEEALTFESRWLLSFWYNEKTRELLPNPERIKRNLSEEYMKQNKYVNVVNSGYFKYVYNNEENI